MVEVGPRVGTETTAAVRTGHAANAAHAQRPRVRQGVDPSANTCLSKRRSFTLTETAQVHLYATITTPPARVLEWLLEPAGLQPQMQANYADASNNYASSSLDRKSVV